MTVTVSISFQRSAFEVICEQYLKKSPGQNRRDSHKWNIYSLCFCVGQRLLLQQCPVHFLSAMDLMCCEDGKSQVITNNFLRICKQESIEKLNYLMRSSSTCHGKRIFYDSATSNYQKQERGWRSHFQRMNAKFRKVDFVHMNFLCLPAEILISTSPILKLEVEACDQKVDLPDSLSWCLGIWYSSDSRFSWHVIVTSKTGDMLGETDLPWVYSAAWFGRDSLVPQNRNNKDV